MVKVNSVLLAAAHDMFTSLVASGMTPENAICQLWPSLRPKRSRAPFWYTARKNDGPVARSYQCPLGSAIGITPEEFGGHSARNRQTVKSLAAIEAAKMATYWLIKTMDPVIAYAACAGITVAESVSVVGGLDDDSAVAKIHQEILSISAGKKRGDEKWTLC